MKLILLYKLKFLSKCFCYTAGKFPHFCTWSTNRSTGAPARTTGDWSPLSQLVHFGRRLGTVRRISHNLLWSHKHSMLLLTLKVLDTLYLSIVFAWKGKVGSPNSFVTNNISLTIGSLQGHAHPNSRLKLGLPNKLYSTNFKSISNFNHNLLTNFNK